VLTAVVMIVDIFWDIAPCSSYGKRRYGGTYHPHLRGRKSAEQGIGFLGQQFPGRLIFDPEDGNDPFLRNVDSYADYTALSQKMATFLCFSSPDILTKKMVVVKDENLLQLRNTQNSQ
jgi:hypothetical protein